MSCRIDDIDSLGGFPGPPVSTDDRLGVTCDSRLNVASRHGPKQATRSPLLSHMPWTGMGRRARIWVSPVPALPEPVAEDQNVTERPPPLGLLRPSTHPLAVFLHGPTACRYLGLGTTS